MTSKGWLLAPAGGFSRKLFTKKVTCLVKVSYVWRSKCCFQASVYELYCVDVTHVCVGVLSLGLGQWGVTVRAVVFTEVIGSLGVGGDQQLLNVSL